MRNCQKGKSCGSSCIRTSYECRLVLGKETSEALSEVKEKLSANAWQRDLLKKLREDTESVTSVDGQVKASEVDWEAAFKEGSREIGGGGYGTFNTVPASRLHASLSDALVGVKTGQLGKSEVASINAVGKLDLGPKLIAARTVGKEGQIAMTVVPGEVMGKAPLITSGVYKFDSYWRARVELHKNGISHGDMHEFNVLIDEKGKARFVDFGFTKVGYGRAFLEALEGALGTDTNSSDLSKGPIWKSIEKKVPTFLKYAKSKVSKDDWNLLTKEGIVPNLPESLYKDLIERLYDNV